MSNPLRTCVGCRQRDSRSSLLRVVLDATAAPAVLVPDVTARLPGRGAWVHPNSACVERAIRRHGLARALRHSGGVDPGRLLAAVAGAES